MPVDQSLVGREFPPTSPYRVSAEKIRELAAATGSPEQPAPATFPIVMAFEAMNAFLADVGSTFRGSCTASSGSPTSGRSRVGDELTATLTVASLRQIGGNDIIGTRSEIPTRAATSSARPARPSCTAAVSCEPRRRLETQTYTVTPRGPGPLRRRQRRLQPDPQDRPGRHGGRAARRDRARDVHDGAGRARGRRPGPVVPRWSSSGCKFTNPVVVPDDDAGVDVVVAGTVKSVEDGLTTIALDGDLRRHRRCSACPRPWFVPDLLGRPHHPAARRTGEGLGARGRPRRS